jgi:hypothetical protein
VDRREAHRDDHLVSTSRFASVALGLALCACTTEVTVTPVIEGPVGDEDASGFLNLDEIQLVVATDGSDRDLVSHTFSAGEDLVLPGAPFGDNLVLHMSGFVGTSNTAYGRTCPFQVRPDSPPIAPHLFFSRSVKFASLGFKPLQRSGGRAVPYLGGAIVVGGTLGPGGGALADVERFDPVSGVYSATLEPVVPRIGAIDAVLGLSPPRIALIGGSTGGAGAEFIELIDPERPKEIIDDTAMARVGLTATSLTDGRVIAIGGNPPGGLPSGLIVELRDAGATIEVRQLRTMLAHPRTGHTATRLGEDVGAPVLVAGGVDGGNPAMPIAAAELFKPLSEELANPATFAPMLVVPRSQHHAALMPDGSVLIIGGLDAGGQPVRTLELFSLDAGFVVVGVLPIGAGIVEITTTTLPDGRILIAGGRATPNTPPVRTAYIARLDPLSGSVDIVTTDKLLVERAGHQAVLLCDGTVLITGGTNDPDVPAERYNPPAAGRR